MTVSIPRPWQLSLLIASVVMVVFLPVCGFDFLIYDDRMHVRDNPLIRDFSLANFYQFWRRPYEGLYIPLTYTLWGMLAKFAGAGDGLDPVPFHTANLLLHVVTVTTLFSLFRFLIKDDWAAAGGALFFALHPLTVGPVSWVSELKGVLSGSLSVLALRQYVLYGAGEGEVFQWSNYRRYLLASLFFAAALLAKPSAMVLPLLAGIVGYLLQSRPAKSLLTELVPWLALVLPVAIVTKFAQPTSQLPFVPDLWGRVLVAGDALSFYALKLIWPFRLAPDYGRIPSVVLAGNSIYLTGLLPWLVLGVALIKKVRPWLVVVGIPCISLLPVLGFIPFTFQGTSTVADRYFYLGLIGPALGVAMLLARQRGRVARVVAVVVLISLAVISSFQMRHWQDTPSLKRHILKINPNSWIAHHNLGIYHHEHNLQEDAIKHYELAIKNKPTFYLSYFNLGYVLALAGDQNGAIENYEKVIEMKPDFIPAYNNLGGLYLTNGLYTKAIAVFEKSVAVKPEFSAGYRALGLLYTLTKRWDESAAAYRKSIAIKPTPEAFNELGHVLLELGLVDEAEAAFGVAAGMGYDSAVGLAKVKKARMPASPPPPPEGF